MTQKENGPAGDGAVEGKWTNTQYTEHSPDHQSRQDCFDRIPQELCDRLQWVVWRFEHASNQPRLTKVPYNPITRKHASSTDARTWLDFITCRDAVRAGGWDGIGFVLSEHDPYTFVDFDLPKDTQGNRIDRPDILQRHLAAIRALASYTEISPGGGLHVIVRGRVASGRKRDLVEVYSSGRFMTMTGNVWTPQ